MVEDRLTFTLGTKLEQNPYTGLEYQPSARLLWTPDHRHSAWGAISRAVRTPSRVQDQAVYHTAAVSLPTCIHVAFGNSGTVSEDLMAYEIGYREQTTEQFSWDIAMFYNVYDHSDDGDAGSQMPLPPADRLLIIPLVVDQRTGQGETYGVELSGNYCGVGAVAALRSVHLPSRCKLPDHSAADDRKRQRSAQPGLLAFRLGPERESGVRPDGPLRRSTCPI